MNYPEAIQFLYGLRLFGAKFGLENTFKLAALAGNPQQKLRFIHVAGTNGKGSTCAMLESVYRVAGLRTGLFTSPHLVSFRERIQVDHQLISGSEVVRLVSGLQPLLKQFPEGHHPTFFEVVTVMALKFFAEQNCELVIWETGLGGRLDATNIVTPLASIITNIALDHQQWLGDTLAKIAFEKGGIIKPGIPVVTAVDEPEALVVIETIAKEKSAPLTLVDPKRFRNMPTPPLIGEHQKINAALALATVEILNRKALSPHSNPLPSHKDGSGEGTEYEHKMQDESALACGSLTFSLPEKFSVTAEHIHKGLAQVQWPGRMQLVERPGGQKILLDGAHNVASANALREALERDFSNRDQTLILGVFEDKDWLHICKTLAPSAKNIFTVPVSSDRRTHPAKLAAVCRAANHMGEISVCGSLGEALEKISSPGHDFVIITGSLYLIGEAMELLGLSSCVKSERELNEWTAVASSMDDRNPTVVREKQA